MAGVFITIEGPEGSGKSTLIQELSASLQAAGMEVVTTREPGGIAIAEKIRSILHDPAHTEMEARTEALLYAAARRQHLVEKVMPTLKRGALVLCDRFIDSSLAYQGYARGLGVDHILQVNQFAVEDCMPDVTLYLDIEPEVGLQRIHADAGREVNRLDMENLAFHQKVREGYLQLVNRFQERMVLIDAARPMEEVAADALSILQGKLKELEG
ncbi:dTMP kinase [Ectobacillus ponti]|uniref:Thymidylate kinase n=1 Tax=Ectobacillus ponti TaxID=2961894 RepID=A0AA42BRQ1_9BACI|nr:dTMP kinase [Ectobacillus ponti]MCP8971202.1 dTMP kinase [Ectobacillus ponti]